MNRTKYLLEQLISGFTLFALLCCLLVYSFGLVVIFTLEEIEKEIYEDMFIVDSLTRTIKLLRGDSTEIYNNEKIFIQQIDQRSNNGSKTEVRGSN